ncbi:unnamed protein product [Phytophthora lilii]|uniref:Unnamed protein product n=1 Tax=Phytophthora lilii TaxID=2077276 RepID=A0A9W6WVC7_9STRA|nr:unnamed protein product [Phytophthora lilii]
MTIPDGKQSPTKPWAMEYNNQIKLIKKKREWKCIFRPSVLVACLAVAVICPIALLLLVTATDYVSDHYVSDASVLIKADASFFASTENDMTMAGGCWSVQNCTAQSLYDFSSLSPEALELGESLDANGAVCQSGTNDWGATQNVVTGSAQQILDVIGTLGLSIAPQMVRELELSVGRTDGCDTRWSMLSLTRLIQFPTKVGDSNFGKLSAVDASIFPDYTECRPRVTIDDNLIGAKVALLKNGEDCLRAVPDSLTLFLYSFSSSLPPVSREVPANNTKYPATTVLQPLLRAYYGGCRMREVNSTGIFIEDTCEVSKH